MCVDGLRARVQTYENAVYSPAGGKAGYDGLVQWAKTNLSAEQKRAFKRCSPATPAQRWQSRASSPSVAATAAF